MHKRLILSGLGLSMFISGAVLALPGLTKVKAIGVAETNSKRPSTKVKKKALEDGRVKAIDKYIAEQPPQKVRALNSVRERILEKVDNYVPEVLPLDDGRWQDGYWRVGVEATINVSQIEALIAEKGEGASPDKLEKENLAFVFVAREVAGVTTFQPEETKRREAKRRRTFTSAVSDKDGKTETSEEAGEESAGESRSTANRRNSANTASRKFGGDSTDEAKDDKAEAEEDASKQSEDKSLQASANKRKAASTVTQKSGDDSTAEETVDETHAGGATEMKAEKLSYRTYSAAMIESKVSEIFAEAGVGVVPAFEAEIDAEWFKSDFSSGDDITEKTKFLAIKAARSSGVRLLAIGTLDVGRHQADEATGLVKTYVVVNAYVMGLQGKFSKRIASVGPVQYSGLGETPEVSKVNALTKAGEEAAGRLVDQLRMKLGK